MLVRGARGRARGVEGAAAGRLHDLRVCAARAGPAHEPPRLVHEFVRGREPALLEQQLLQQPLRAYSLYCPTL